MPDSGTNRPTLTVSGSCAKPGAPKPTAAASGRAARPPILMRLRLSIIGSFSLWLARPDAGLHAEVGLADAIVGAQRRGRPFQHHAPGLEHVAVVGRLERFGDSLLDQKDR